MPFDLEALKDFPTDPGVYIMKNRQGKVLYIGKAKNIRQRVKQYFTPGVDTRPMVPVLISQVANIETIIVSSEKEALLLENTLIKEHQPKYNALLKDDKTYIALKINNRHPWPRLELVRYRGRPKADGLYFGPYTSAFAARQTADLLQKIFPMRQCSDQELLRRTRPCILYDMKRCVAPCVDRCTHEEYEGYVKSAIKFLRGHDSDIVNDLKEQMKLASDQLEFERAAELQRTIQQIERTIENQSVDKPLGNDTDAIGIFREGEEIMLSQLLFRGGKLVATRDFEFSGILDDDAQLLNSFLIQHYVQYGERPHEILLPVQLDDEQILTDLLSENQRHKVRVHTPIKGEKRSVVEMAIKNAEAAFRRGKDQALIREKTLLEMQEKFHLTRFPEHIECFDNSNIAGTNLVSALVAFNNGEKDSSRYRKYKIRTVDTSDDYGAMREVLSRRYRNAKEENNLPDLVIIDGGKGHLNVAIKIFQELDIVSVDLISVAKEEGRHDKGITLEQVFLPNIKDPIILPRHSRILFLLQQIRDEAHRSAIGFHRKLREKKTVKSALDDVPGIGPAKRKALLKAFGSVKGIIAATDEQLLQIKGITPLLVNNLRKNLRI